METLETLSVALGFATLAGLNLYLVVLVAGLAINQGWVDVSTTYPDLLVLGDPAVVTAAGVFFCLEFFSDKVPWVDSFWDSIHTLVRPVGGALLAIHTLGPTDPAFEVIIGLLAGGATLMSHGLKAGTRVAINTSPEPVTNVAASITEDLAVLGGLALIAANPFIAAGICIVFLGLSAWIAPVAFRRVKATAWLVWNRITSFVIRPTEKELFYAGLSPEENAALADGVDGRETDVAWSTRVLIGKSKRIPGLTNMTFGRLVAESHSVGSLHVISRRWWKHRYAELTLDGLAIEHRSRKLSEEIVLTDEHNKRELILRLPAGHASMAERLVESLEAIRNRTDAELPSDRIMVA